MQTGRLSYAKKVWATSTAGSMYIEFISIITCRVLYLAFREHRL